MKELLENKLFTTCIILLCVFVFGKTNSACAKEKNNSWIINNDIKKLGKGWYELTGNASLKNVTPKNAENKAILDACRKALEFHCGVQVTSQTHKTLAKTNENVVQNDFILLSRQTSDGIVLEKKVIDKYLDGSNFEYYVLAKVKVGKQKGKSDSSFKISASLNRNSFVNGDSLELTLKSTKACYVSVLNIAEGEVYVLFPNEYMKDNQIKADTVISIPGEKNKAIGVTFPATLPKGKKKELGVIKVIATKEQFPITDLSKITPYGTYSVAFKKLRLQILDIPKDQITEFDLQYNISD